jgi:hypothetical protein
MRARYARPGDCFEVLRFVQPKPAFGSRRADCFGERVLRIALGGGGERQQTFAVDRVVEGDHIGDPRAAQGQGAGLVDQHDIGLGE